MSSSIRGHKTRIELVVDGAEVVLDTITGFSVNQDGSFMRSEYVGNPLPEGDQSIQGFSGSMDMEVKDDRIELIIDALVTNNLNGIGISEYQIIDTEEYPDGSISTYAYFDIQLKIGKSASGLSEKVTKKLDFQASGRVRV